MILSRISPEDIDEIKAIHSKLGFEWKEPCLHIGTIAVRTDRQLIGAGFLRPIVEAVMVLDPDARKADKARALYEMMAQAIADTKDTRLDEIHAWVKEPEFVKVLQNHYKFEEPRGRSLVLRL